MPTNDLDNATERLKQKNIALAIAKKGEVVFETSAHGLGGLLKAIDELGEEMRGSSVADNVVGQAAAFLCVHAGVVAVFAVTASAKGIQTLRDNDIFCRCENMVQHILDSKRKDVCPFEKLVDSISNPEEAYEKLKSLAAERMLM